MADNLIKHRFYFFTDRDNTFDSGGGVADLPELMGCFQKIGGLSADTDEIELKTGCDANAKKYPGVGYCLNGARTGSVSDSSYKYFCTVRSTDLITYLLVKAATFSKLKLKRPNLVSAISFVCNKILKKFRDEDGLLENFSVETDTSQTGITAVKIGLKHFEVNEFTYISVGDLS